MPDRWRECSFRSGYKGRQRSVGLVARLGTQPDRFHNARTLISTALSAALRHHLTDPSDENRATGDVAAGRRCREYGLLLRLAVLNHAPIVRRFHDVRH